jgi:hypothetical protein
MTRMAQCDKPSSHSIRGITECTKHRVRHNPVARSPGRSNRFPHPSTVAFPDTLALSLRVVGPPTPDGYRISLSRAAEREALRLMQTIDLKKSGGAGSGSGAGRA